MRTVYADPIGWARTSLGTPKKYRTTRNLCALGGIVLAAVLVLIMMVVVPALPPSLQWTGSLVACTVIIFLTLMQLATFRALASTVELLDRLENTERGSVEP